METPTIPFSMLALAPFIPGNASHVQSPAEVTLSNLDQVMAAFGPKLTLPVPAHLCPQEQLVIEFNRLDGFSPDVLARSQPYLRRIVEANKYLDDASREGTSAETMAARLNENYNDLPITFSPPEAEKPEAAGKITGDVDDILSMVEAPSDGPSASAVEAGRVFRAQLDNLLSSLLERIFGHEDFRMLESTWRGVDTLLRQGPVKMGSSVGLSLFPVEKSTFHEDMDRLLAGLGGDLPNLALVDLPLGSSSDDFKLMEEIVDLADQLLMPSVCWVTPGFFKLKYWRDLDDIKDMKEHLSGPSHSDWRRIMAAPGADKASVTCNRFLVRPPYGPEDSAETSGFTEREFLWISPVWAVGALAAQSTASFGWPSRFNESANFRLKGLTFVDSKDDRPLVTEMECSDLRVGHLADVRIMPLVGPVRRDEAMVPRDITLNGGALRVQLFISRVLQILFYARNHMDEEIRTGDMSANLTAFFTAQWEKTGHPVPQDLNIRAEQTTAGLVVTIGLTPLPTIAPGAPKFGLSFPW